MKRVELRQKINAALLALLLPCVVWAFGFLESRCLFHPESSDFPNNPLAAIANHPLRQRVQDVYLETADGVRLNGWFVTPQTGKPTIVFAHGNGGNIGDRYGMIQLFIDRGYGFLRLITGVTAKAREIPLSRAFTRICRRPVDT